MGWKRENRKRVSRSFSDFEEYSLRNRRAVKTTGTTDFEGDAKIRYINFNAKSLEAASSIHLTEPSPILLINGQLEDVTRLDDMELASAIGWLAREEKIQFEFDKERGNAYIYLICNVYIG